MFITIFLLPQKRKTIVKKRMNNKNFFVFVFGALLTKILRFIGSKKKLFAVKFGNRTETGNIKRHEKENFYSLFSIG